MKLEDITLDWLQARVIERDGCWIWAKAVNQDSGLPVARIGAFTRTVRPILWELIHEKPMPKGMRSACTCGEKLCLHPDHIGKMKHAKMLRGRKRPASECIKIALSNRARSKVPESVVIDARNSTDPVRKAAKRLGISSALVGMYRRNEVRRDFSNPFAGLA